MGLCCTVSSKCFLYRHGFFNAKSVFAGPVLRTESDSVFISEQKE